MAKSAADLLEETEAAISACLQSQSYTIAERSQQRVQLSELRAFRRELLQEAQESANGAGAQWHNSRRRRGRTKAFESEEEAVAWLKKDSTNYHPIVWNNEGLVAGWSKTLPRRQLNVDVWQIYINGKKPTALRGAIDKAIEYRVPE